MASLRNIVIGAILLSLTLLSAAQETEQSPSECADCTELCPYDTCRSDTGYQNSTIERIALKMFPGVFMTYQQASEIVKRLKHPRRYSGSSCCPTTPRLQAPSNVTDIFGIEQKVIQLSNGQSQFVFSAGCGDHENRKCLCGDKCVTAQSVQYILVENSLLDPPMSFTPVMVNTHCHCNPVQPSLSTSGIFQSKFKFPRW